MLRILFSPFVFDLLSFVPDEKIWCSETALPAVTGSAASKYRQRCARPPA